MRICLNQIIGNRTMIYGSYDPLFKKIDSFIMIRIMLNLRKVYQLYLLFSERREVIALNLLPKYYLKLLPNYKIFLTKSLQFRCIHNGK